MSCSCQLKIRPKSFASHLTQNIKNSIVVTNIVIFCCRARSLTSTTWMSFSQSIWPRYFRKGRIDAKLIRKVQPMVWKWTKNGQLWAKTAIFGYFTKALSLEAVGGFAVKQNLGWCRLLSWSPVSPTHEEYFRNFLFLIFFNIFCNTFQISMDDW